MSEKENKYQLEVGESGDEKSELPKSVEYLQYISVFILLVLDGLLIAVILIVSRLNIVVEEGLSIDASADLESSADSAAAESGFAHAVFMFYPQREITVGQETTAHEAIPEIEKTVVIILLVCVALVFFILLEVAIWGCRRRRDAKALTNYDVSK